MLNLNLVGRKWWRLFMFFKAVARNIYTLPVSDLYVDRDITMAVEDEPGLPF
jgi:hypothetical protein